MSQNWIRTCSLQVDGGPTIQCSPDGLRVRFETISRPVQTLDEANIIITNPSREMVAQLQKQYTKISLIVGYENGNQGVLFSGSVTRSQFGEKENNYTDVLLKLWLADGDTWYNQAKISKTLAAGATPQDIVNECFKTMEPFGVKMGKVLDVDLSTPKFPKSCTLYGMTRDILRQVGLTKGATWNTNFGQLNFVGKDSAGSGDAVSLSPKTGLIGQPIQQEEGILVRCLINPAIRVDGKVQINAGSIVQQTIQNDTLQAETGSLAENLKGQGANDGIYRVLQVHTNADTRGNDWYMDLVCIGAITGYPNKVQIGMGLG